MSTQSRILALDIGTSSVKALLVALDGSVVGSRAAPLAMATPEAGWAEQNPEDWWAAAVTAIKEVLAANPGQVDAVGLSGQMHSSVFLDASGSVVRPALLWCDGRTTSQCKEIVDRAGGEGTLRDWVANPALEGFTLPKVLWLRQHEPAAFARTSIVLLPKDFIRLRLTGTVATEPSDASGTLMYDPVRGRWSEPILKAVGLSPSLLPTVGASAEILSRVSPEGAASTGLIAGTPVVGGGADNACGAAGVGAIGPGDCVVSWGTSGTVLAPTREPLVDPSLRVHTFNHVAPNTWYLMGVVLSAGGAFSWYRDRFAPDLARAADPDARLTAEAASVPIGAEGVSFLPYLQGERTPHRNAALRGAFTGLSMAHTRAHLSRAVLEGIAFALRDSLEILAELGVAPDQLLLTGGGAKSTFLRELEADVFDRPVVASNNTEGPALGAALLAAVGIGVFPDLAEGARAVIARQAPLDPDPERAARYRILYRGFQERARSADRLG